MVTDLQTDGKTFWDNNEICTNRGLREHFLKNELNPFSGLGRDVKTSFFLMNENLTYVYTNYTSSLITNNIFTKLESHNNYNK